MGGKSAPDPPDYSELAEVSRENAKLLKEVYDEQLVFAREQDALNREVLDEYLTIAMPAMREEAAFARAQRERYQDLQSREDSFLENVEDFTKEELERYREGRDQVEAYGDNLRSASDRALRVYEGGIGDQEGFAGRLSDVSREDLRRYADSRADEDEFIGSLRGMSERGLSRYRKDYVPLEQDYIERVRNYDTPARREAEAARRIADVSASFDAERANAARELEGYGIDPSMTRYQGLDRAVRTAEAAAQAQAGNQGRQDVEERGLTLAERGITQGRTLQGTSAQLGNQAVGLARGAAQTGSQLGGQSAAVYQNVGSQGAQLGGQGANLNRQSGATAIGLQADAANFVRGVPSQTAQSYNTALSAGSSGVSGTQSTGAAGSNLYGSAADTLGRSQNMTMQGAQLMNMGFQNALAGYQAETQRRGNLLGAVGQGVGLAAGIWGGAEGGEVDPAEGGHGTNPDGSRARHTTPYPQPGDSVPHLLQEGEYVIPKEVVRAKGTEFFDRLVEKYLGS